MSATSVLHKFFAAVARWTGTIGSGGVTDGTTQTIPLSAATNLTNGTAYVFTMNRVNSGGTKQSTWETAIGVLSGTNFINCTRGVEGTAQAWSAGVVVEILMTAAHWNKMVEGIEVEHNQDGTHKTLTSQVLVTPKITTSINDANGNEIIKTPATTSAVNEVTVTNAATGTKPQIAATGGDTNIDLDLRGKGTGTVMKPTTVVVQIFDGGTDTSTGDGKAYFTIPEELNGMNLVGVHGRVVTAGTTGTTDFQIANVTDSVDMLSTKLTIDSGETGSDTAATPAVIDATKDDVATNDLLRIDCDAVASTKAKGGIIRLRFALP